MVYDKELIKKGVNQVFYEKLERIKEIQAEEIYKKEEPARKLEEERRIAELAFEEKKRERENLSIMGLLFFPFKKRFIATIFLFLLVLFLTSKIPDWFDYNRYFNFERWPIYFISFLISYIIVQFGLIPTQDD